MPNVPRQPDHTPPPAERAAWSAIRAGDVAGLARLLDADPELVHVEVGAGGSLLGEVAQPDVFGASLPPSPPSGARSFGTVPRALSHIRG
jgi:hypothetical protein